ncbi:transposase [Alkaliphilus serpentinus]|uniref:Transposase n=1 Tax=Alkaliphilus serpentinus TaxID=1482731 RepID=A0A833HM37_9FIRM|nr:transposase [Alkaliphilus serpentinus]KAB3527106.1 transposase [Alkaliphilus serpentinus]
MLNTACKQISYFELSHEIDELTSDNSVILFDLFDNYVDLKSLIPLSFYRAYYPYAGRNRDFPLEGMIKALIVSDLLGLPSTALLISFIKFSAEFRKFLGFSRVPHKSQFSRFKSQFYDEIKKMFHHTVDFTDSLAYDCDEFKSQILITDTTGFELFVKENNPKFFENILKTSKILAKTYPDNKNFDPIKHAQSKMPKCSVANPDAKLAFLNGHFGYFRKAILSTNGFGLIRDINFIDSDNTLETDLTPQQTKDLYDSVSLIPALETYFQLHPNHDYDFFLGDAGFDSDDNYAYLYKKEITPIIPINQRNHSELPQPGYDEDGVPTCPHDPNLPMKYTGIVKGKNRSDRIQYICPKRTSKMTNGKSKVILECDNPCTKSPFGRIKNLTIHHNYRYNSAMPRSSHEWIELYKIRTVCERTIAQLKSMIQIKTTNVRSTISLQANVLLAGITQLIAFVLLYHSKIKHGKLAIKSLLR